MPNTKSVVQFLLVDFGEGYLYNIEQISPLAVMGGNFSDTPLMDKNGETPN